MARRTTLLALTLSIGVALPAIGCSKPGPKVIEVIGKVTYRGQPVSKGVVSFMPAAAEAATHRPASAALAEDGSYRLRAFPGRDGAMPGEYRVAISSYEGSYIDRNVKHLIPEKFFSPETSGLSASVPSVGDSPIEINLDLKD